MAMRRRTRLWLTGLAVAIVAAGGAGLLLLRETGSASLGEAPPRAVAAPLPPPPPSTIALPVRVPLAMIAQAVNEAVPRQLWQVDKPDAVCVKASQVKILGSAVKLTPDVKCRIVGQVTRGPITLSGQQGQIRLKMPVSAMLEARDIGGVIAREGTEASAIITADLQPILTPDGRLSARIRLNYNWQREPAVNVLGQEIRLTEKADEKLAPVLAKAEAELSRRLAALPVRVELEKLWRQGFTVQSINRRNPAAWLRLTPQSLAFAGASVENAELRIDARLGTVAEVVLGTAPRPAAPVPLPAIAIQPEGRNAGLALNIAIVADPATLQTAIDKALAKVAARGVEVPDVGRVRVRFGRSTLYATPDGKLALGLDIAARGPRQMLDTRGRLWLTARPETGTSDERLRIRDLDLVAAPGADVQFPLLVAVAESATVRGAVEDALAQDFARDYKKLMQRIDLALAEVPIGGFTLSVLLNRVQHGKAVVVGDRLYLPVTAHGIARLDLPPA